jgi:hypothetical protein
MSTLEPTPEQFEALASRRADKHPRSAGPVVVQYVAEHRDLFD